MLQFWSAFTASQRRNIAFYVLGIMCYKFALEYYNGAFITLANERFAKDKYQKIGILTGINYAAQGIGSILISPLIKRYPTRSVLSLAVLGFAIISAILLITDAATGGQPRTMRTDGKDFYGKYDPNLMFPIFALSGISYGMVELIRRVIPRDIVGGDVHRLRKMDAFVHVVYEIAGTAGAFTSTALIGKLGYNYSFALSPPLFALAALLWTFISTLGHTGASHRAALKQIEHSQIVAAAPGYFIQIVSGLRAFAKAFYVGAYIIFSRRSLIWLVPSYTLALYGHRYLENVLAPIVAKQVLGVSSYSQIMVGGSNFGELCGSMSVMFFTNSVPTPMPWLRLDAVLLMLVWVLPYIKLETNNVASAWRLAGIFLPVSYGWAAGDVSLAAYIQSTLARMESTDRDVSALGAVMAFLYVLYIVIYALVSTFLGRWVDSQINGAVGAAAVGPAKKALVYVAGVHFTILAAIIIASTFIPRGALAFNPKPEGDLATPTDEEVEMARNGSEASDEYDLKEGISKRHGAKDDVTAGM
ncbi:unnamed protein product [Tilletia controversa]|uniref:Uncharacterized protein n=3 Tax=Tilletia TaxID=13289 RepID=A0A8X7T011_9BASI|nr:hypothetical protein CF336_g8571 [Tilletia laevis]KAE8183313.1 hypothetical protein CF328_g8222 [Tilletia controversa]KAE8242700.1 hypothetical protein A4X03_0g7985 [Tilletia caries]KAE8183960.1 hypothetical protein CF335_g8164 [Tilletia laevis]KAE8253976.1 hypothetical protein A4X06_0g1133 [Tilletia controversa]